MQYAAITSLEQTLQQILLHPRRCSIPWENKHIESFHEKLGFLQRFLEEYRSNKRNEKVTSLEKRIRDAAYEAEDFMDLHLNNLSDSEEMMGQINIELMMNKVDSMIEEMTEIKEQMGLEIKHARGSSMEEEIKIGKVLNLENLEHRNALRKDSSKLVLSDRKNLAVGFEDYLMQIEDQLTGQSCAREVISIVGMGGIDEETGSRILLTTRTADVAVYASPSGTLHQISLLSDDQSWKLLCPKVFGDEPCPLNLQEIGKTIAQNCRGLPLSIVVIGGLLSKVEKTQMAWQVIAENVTSFVFSSDDRCSDILRLSYNHLPQYLKACFLYMAVFPKNHEIFVTKLTKMWVAEGFLRQDHGQSPEEVAERCVEDLIDRSLILTWKKNSEGKIKAFRIHDLLLEFCVKEAKDEKFLQIIENLADLFATSSSSEPRISIHRVEEFKHSRFDFDSKSSTSYARSLVFVGECFLSSNLFLRFKLLRVLDTTQVDFLEFPSQVLELLNLRYMALICDDDIPASITKLWNLQTLIIYENSWESSKNGLPVEIWMMVNLRHLKFDRVNFLDPSAAKFDFNRKHLVLEDFQTLSGIWNLRFTRKMLQSIPNIKKIDVSYDLSGLIGKEWSYYEIDNLGNLHHLTALKIHLIPNRSWSMYLVSLPAHNFRFPPSLKTLTLGGVGFPWHDLTIIGSLPNLEVLKLKDLACVGTEWEPNEEEFCKLKVLVLETLELKHWKADSSHFPSLERLIIRRCDDLVEIPSGMGESPTLTTIGLYKCNASVLASANEILKKQLSYGNDGFQVINVDPKTKSYRHDSSLARCDHVVEEIKGSQMRLDVNNASNFLH